MNDHEPTISKKTSSFGSRLSPKTSTTSTSQMVARKSGTSSNLDVIHNKTILEASDDTNETMLSEASRFGMKNNYASILDSSIIESKLRPLPFALKSES